MISAKETRLKQLRFEEVRIREISAKNESHNLFGAGITFGLIFGIIGNLYITLLYDYLLRQSSDNTQLIFLEILTFLIIVTLLITIKEDRQFKKKETQIHDRLYQNLDEQDKLEGELGI